MTSLSLPRVLHPRKTSLEIERENFEKSQATAINKAINNIEAPVKQKHVRSAIIGTFQQQGAQTFWSVALRLPAMDDRIVAWKFCHVLHKVLREGHPLCLVHSQRHRRDLDEIGKLWGHLREGYGKMIRLYTLLLMTKLDFHRRNPRFPGHLGVTPEELESIGANDINNYFQMSVEMFDYIDNILDLQSAIFGSLDMSRSNSMTSAGQCRLAPLIPCIQDASKLYDYCVKILFKLHSSLPPDTLSGHRDRFLKQFKGLKQFYQNTNALQYFKDLITVPPLPENPPNFLIQANLHTYVTQEVFVPQEEEEATEGSLIDTSDAPFEHTETQSQDSGSSQFQIHSDIIAERDNLIRHLQQELQLLKDEFSKLVSDHRKEVAGLEEHITTVETKLATKESELLQEKQVKEDLVNQAFAVAQSQDSEQKVKDEKFNKLKNIYVNLRENHIQLLREKADIEKKLEAGNKQMQEAQQSNSDLQNKIQELTHERAKMEEKFQRSSVDQNEELENLRRDKDLFNMETEILKKSIEDACKEKDEAYNLYKSAVKEKESLHDKLKELEESLEKSQERITSVCNENAVAFNEIIAKSIGECEQILKQIIHEVDNPALAAVSCSPDYLRSLTADCRGALEMVNDLNPSDAPRKIVTAYRIAHKIATYILQGRATSNTSPDIMFGERMAEACKTLGESVLNLLQRLRANENIDSSTSDALEKLQAIATLAETISGSLQGATAENLADLLEDEMTAMDKAIVEAANCFQEMLAKSRAKDSGIKLEVNEKIIDSCTSLMQAIRVLVEKSRLLQAEIVAQGRGTTSAKEFYKRNHQWTDGFISAAKSIGGAAKFLLTAADKVVTSDGKLELLVVASHEISASTAQLVVATRVKADRKSENLKQLTQASKVVTTATGHVVAIVKDCSQLIDEAEELDTSNLSLHQAKRLEMDSQVRVLELEKELQEERLRLAALRRRHYQLAGEGEGWV